MDRGHHILLLLFQKLQKNDNDTTRTLSSAIYMVNISSEFHDSVIFIQRSEKADSRSGSGANGEKCGIWDRLSHNAPDSDSPINQFCVKLPHLIASWASCKVLTRSLDILLLRDQLSHNFNRVRNLLSKFYFRPIEAKYCEHYVENNFSHPHKASMLHERKGYGLLAQTTDNK